MKILDFFRKRKADSDASFAEFTVPYMWYAGEDYRYTSVKFDFSRYDVAFINGEEVFFPSSRINDLGWSSDHQYRKISTLDFIFWISPREYTQFMRCIKSMQKKYFEIKKEKDMQRKEFKRQQETAFTPDAVTDECVKCFCVGTDGEMRYYVSNGQTLLSYISDTCSSHGGHMYKTRAKGAKCAILVAPSSRNKKSYDLLRAAGYTVVLPEDFCAFWGSPDVYAPADAKKDFKLYISSL